MIYIQKHPLHPGSAHNSFTPFRIHKTHMHSRHTPAILEHKLDLLVLPVRHWSCITSTHAPLVASALKVQGLADHAGAAVMVAHKAVRATGMGSPCDCLLKSATPFF